MTDTSDAKVGGSDAATPNWYILVCGLAPPTKNLVLAPGISLIPLSRPLTIFELAGLGGAGFDAWAIVSQVANNCRCEIESAHDSATEPGYDTLNRAWLASAMLVLRGFGSVLPVACNSYRWSTIPDLIKQSNGRLPPFSGGLLEFHVKVLLSSAVRADAPSDEDARWIEKYFGLVNKLAADSASFRFALEACIDWRFSKDFRIAMARLWAGIEALFHVSAELVFRLSAYAASLLRPRGADRSETFGRVKKLYGIRSKAVHGDKVSDDELQAGVSSSFELLRDLLMCCIERGGAPTEKDLNAALFE